MEHPILENLQEDNQEAEASISDSVQNRDLKWGIIAKCGSDESSPWCNGGK